MMILRYNIKKFCFLPFYLYFTDTKSSVSVKKYVYMQLQKIMITVCHCVQGRYVKLFITAIQCTSKPRVLYYCYALK